MDVTEERADECALRCEQLGTDGSVRGMAPDALLAEVGRAGAEAGVTGRAFQLVGGVRTLNGTCSHRCGWLDDQSRDNICLNFAGSGVSPMAFISILTSSIMYGADGSL